MAVSERLLSAASHYLQRVEMDRAKKKKIATATSIKAKEPGRCKT